MKTIPITEFDIIFVSYDEDNAEEHWSDLKSKLSWAKRVHRIYGSDAAHKAAADIADTERFITIDADTIIENEFFNTTIPKNIATNKGIVVSWSSTNAVNGLVYGNGSLKCWTKTFVHNMKTHENSSNPKNRIEFCFEDGYTQSNKILSTTYPNGSPKQAFRSGFREGVKMCLDQGTRIPKDKLVERMYWKNLIRLLVWCSVGHDIENGIWGIYGARLGCHMLNIQNWDYINVRDFEYINKMWDEKISPVFESFTSRTMCTRTGYSWDEDNLIENIFELGLDLKQIGLNVANLKKEDCSFFRDVFINPNRIDKETI